MEDMQKKVKELLLAVDEEKRPELLDKLMKAETQEDRIALAEEYLSAQGGEIPEWLNDGHELTDQELRAIAGGTDLPWDYDVDEYGCY